MSKATLEFNLPEEKEEFDTAYKGHIYKQTIEELDNWLRALSKYEDKEQVYIDAVRSKIREIERDLND